MFLSDVFSSIFHDIRVFVVNEGFPLVLTGSIPRCHLPNVYTNAEDTLLHLALKLDSVLNTDEAITAMEPYVQEIRTWMLSDKFKNNDSKTEFFMIGRTSSCPRSMQIHSRSGKLAFHL